MERTKQTKKDETEERLKVSLKNLNVNGGQTAGQVIHVVLITKKIDNKFSLKCSKGDNCEFNHKQKLVRMDQIVIQPFMSPTI